MTPDGGSLLLREPDKRYKVTETVVSCLTDYRCPDCITCELLTIVRQRIMSIVMGYKQNGCWCASVHTDF